MSQEFAKNNDKPTADSVLWEFADDWKTSQQTGLSYASMPGFERKDAGLYEGLRSVIKSKKIEDIEYQSYYLVPTLFPNKDKTQKDPNIVSNWHVFVFENVNDARKKAESQNRFIKWDVVPKPVASPPAQQTLTNSPKTSSSTKLSEVGPSNPQQTHVQAPVVSQSYSPLLTYTDPRIVDTEEAKKLEQEGFSFIPSILLKDNHWKEDIYDDADGQIIGSKHMFVIGRIINAKIADN